MTANSSYRIVAGNSGAYYSISEKNGFNYQQDSDSWYDILQSCNQVGDYGSENQNSGWIYNIGTIVFQKSN